MSFVHDSLGSLNMNPSDLMMANYSSGMQINGRMSAVRRFFCLFVTFDMLFTALFWIICVMIDGKELIDGLKLEIVDYDIKISMFDVVVCSLIRFCALILFYAIIHINHWWLVAITTATSCAFLIAKSLIYKWTDSGHTSYPFRVMLVLLSFLISWAEAWFVDFRILAQEARGRLILENIAGERNSADGDRRDLERIRDCLSRYTESVGNFYSPLESPADSGDEENFRDIKAFSPYDLDIKKQGTECLNLAWTSITSEGWSLEKAVDHSCVIHSKSVPGGRKVFRLNGLLEGPPQVIYNDFVMGFVSMPLWNKGVSDCKVIKTLDDNMDLTYQVAQQRGGLIKTRDFVNVRIWKKYDQHWILANTSVTHPDIPATNKYVRGENGPSCLVFYPVDDNRNETKFSWLLDVQLKVWIPSYVIENAMSQIMEEFFESLKSRVAQLRTGMK